MAFRSSERRHSPLSLSPWHFVRPERRHSPLSLSPWHFVRPERKKPRTGPRF